MSDQYKKWKKQFIGPAIPLSYSQCCSKTGHWNNTKSPINPIVATLDLLIVDLRMNLRVYVLSKHSIVLLLHTFVYLYVHYTSSQNSAICPLN